MRELTRLGALASMVLVATACARSANAPSAGVPSEAVDARTELAQTTTEVVEPRISLNGVVPAPGATVPPMAPRAIPGLTIQALAAAAQAQGLPCESWAGAYGPDEGQGYLLGCEGQNVPAHAKFGLDASYWTLSDVSDIHLSVWPDAVQTVVGPAPATSLFPEIGGLAAGDPAETWVRGHLDDPACRPTCTRTFGTVRVLLTVGSNGGRQLDIYGYE